MIDLLIGGSPCQGFSFAGKQLNFFDSRSKLFFDYVKALEFLKPKYFIFENVKMKKEYQDVINKYLEVKPIEINSALVSAQNRIRLYWTNIPGVKQPEDKGILLKDIIESGCVDRDKSLCLTNRYGGFVGSQNLLRRRYFGKSMGQVVFENCTPEVQKKYWQIDDRMEWDGIGNLRSLTVNECERLQTLPVGYVGKIINESKAKEVIGNGWTVDVIAHILSFIPETHLHTVVSLFDGISCGQVALERAKKIYNRYYSSEIDKYAIAVTKKNYPHTIQLGDVTKIDWNAFIDKLDLIKKVS